VRNAQLSPDGKFVAYSSNETGAWDVYVTRSPVPGSKWQVSHGGGEEARWRRDGKELFYLLPEGTLMSAKVNLGSSFEAMIPLALFQSRRRQKISMTGGRASGSRPCNTGALGSTRSVRAAVSLTGREHDVRELHPLVKLKEFHEKGCQEKSSAATETTDKRPFIQCSAESNVTRPATTVMRIASALKSLLGTLYGSAEITVKSA
jgi:hypothetical protein